MSQLIHSPNATSILWNRDHQVVVIESWGSDAVRVRSTILDNFTDLPSALLPQPMPTNPTIRFEESKGILINGKLRTEISQDGQISFFHSQSDNLLLAEEAPHFTRPPSRWFRPHPGSDTSYLEVRFIPQPGERFYGLGQHQHGKLNQRGCVIDQLQRNTEVCIPFLLSSLGYGFLWNNPGVGRVELSENGTRWVAESTPQLDYYFVVGDTTADILENYANAVGHAPDFPEFAAGFWQCKLRYRNQEELLEIAREYKRRNLPISVIVIDFFHWTMMGDWQFDPVDWPDPTKMVEELGEMGIKLMVSIWPTVNRASKNFEQMNLLGLLTRNERGNPVHMIHLPDSYPPNAPVMLTYYDPMNPAGRKFIWDQIYKGYYRHGIKVFWLDACEPEFQPIDHDAVRYHLGSGPEVGLSYPLYHQRAFWEGMIGEGESSVINLCRSAWAGSQRYGAAVWSGDIASTFESLRLQVPAGLNIGLSGIPWWTTDIGGFLGGDIRTPYFKELIVRWFQYGTFCPLFRLHGNRDPITREGDTFGNGAPNEVWSFGDTAYSIIRRLMFIREEMKSYLLEQMRIASEKGLPPMRPLFVDFLSDGKVWEVEDQFLLGPDLLVAPVLFEGAVTRRLYLPEGVDWIDAWSGDVFQGGKWIEVSSPLEKVPVFWRSGSPWFFRFDQVQIP